jgi:hypothetical protein
VRKGWIKDEIERMNILQYIQRERDREVIDQYIQQIETEFSFQFLEKDSYVISDLDFINDLKSARQKCILVVVLKMAGRLQPFGLNPASWNELALVLEGKKLKDSAIGNQWKITQDFMSYRFYESNKSLLKTYRDFLQIKEVVNKIEKKSLAGDLIQIIQKIEEQVPEYIIDMQ